MTTLVLTVIGDDRAGLVSSLSGVIARHHGNWTTSQLAELAGKFAGIVLVEVDEQNAGALAEALEPLKGLLDVTVHQGNASAPAGDPLTLDLVGADRPGIVQDITSVITHAGGSIETLTSRVTEAPMAGGDLFTARAVVRVDSAHTAGLRAELEKLADTFMVDFTFDD